MNPAAPKDFKTVCRICQQTFDHNAIMPPLLGGEQRRPERLIKFVTGLGQHLNSAHAAATLSEMGEALQTFSGLLILNHFETTDPTILRVVDSARAEIHKRTRKHFVTDAAILDLVSRLGLDPEHEQSVAALMRGMRDAYEELGQFSPEAQENRLVVA